MHVLILGNDPKTLVNFRGPLIEALLAQGHRVTAAGAGFDARLVGWLADRGVSYFDVPIERAGLNPLADLATLARFVRLMRAVKPDLVFAYMIKPVVYGLIAGRLAGVKRRAAMITGLGYAFTESAHEPLRARAKRAAVNLFARGAYALALRFADTVIFQNGDDRDAFASLRLTRAGQRIGLVNGSGVDLAHFAPAPMPAGPVTFLMIARLLRDKGVYEYVEAARQVTRAHPHACFVLVGPFDANPAAVARHEVEAWVAEGVIDYHGALDDVRGAIAAAHVFVLPSYREGCPRTVLEAMAMGRPVITTDVPGCRETVVEGANGLLVPPRDAPRLARVLKGLAQDAALRERMGAASLEIARSWFDKTHVAAATARILLRPAMLETSVAIKGERTGYAGRTSVGVAAHARASP
jgi:glycosyltransferase involved in cell wall biosynthesis